MKKLVVFSGAGISAESGIKTFRDANGLWEGRDVMEVASPNGWANNQELVLDFYNQRRKQAKEVTPNRGHQILAELESHYKVNIITQNVDDLHERAGSTNIIHLHGELFYVRSSVDSNLIYHIDEIDQKGWELKQGDLCDKGSQLRPHIVWFGEAVPMMKQAIQTTQNADLFVVVGTSLQVYPAASLLDFVGFETPIYVIDPNMPDLSPSNNLTLIEEGGSSGLSKLKDILLADL